MHITCHVRQTKELDLELTPPPATSRGVKDVVTALLQHLAIKWSEMALV